MKLRSLDDAVRFGRDAAEDGAAILVVDWGGAGALFDRCGLWDDGRFQQWLEETESPLAAVAEELQVVHASPGAYALWKADSLASLNVAHKRAVTSIGRDGFHALRTFQRGSGRVDFIAPGGLDGAYVRAVWLSRPARSRPFAVTLVDVVDEERAAVRAQQQDEARYRAIVQDQTDFIVRYRPDGVRTFVNDAYAAFFGGSPEDFVGTSFLPLVVEEHRPEVVEKIRRLCAREAEALEEEHLSVRHDGARCWTHWVDRAVFDGEGNFVELQAVGRDITERKRAEMEMRASGKRRDLALEGARAGFWDYIPGTGWVDMAPQCFRLLGRETPPPPHSSETWRELVHPDDLPAVQERLQRFLAASDGDYQVEFRMRAADGTWRWIDSRGAAVEHDSDGKVARMTGILMDVTERRHAEEERRERERQLQQADKMVTLGTLVSGVAHEINNPTHFIALNVAPLKKAWADARPILDRYLEDHGDFGIAGGPYSARREQIVEMLGGIEEGAKRINRIVEDLREYARGRPEQELAPTRIDLVVNAAVGLVRSRIVSSTSRFEIVHGEGIPEFPANGQRLQQVVINLVLNACQSLPDRRASVRITTSFDAASGTVLLGVTDEGEGIPEELLPRITDPFFTTRRTSGGTGLGLSICQRIVKEHGGTLLFDSRPGRGTTVTVSLPINRGGEAGP